MLKNLLIVTAWLLVSVTVYASSILYGSASATIWGSAEATIENRKGFYIFPTEDAPEAGEGVDGSMVDVDFDSELTELFTTPDYESIVEAPEPALVFDSEENLIVDEPDVEEQDLADTLLLDEVREE